MKKQLPLFWILTLLLIGSTAGQALAQSIRAEQTGFIKPRVGVASYIGDLDEDIFDFGEDSFPWSAGLELGYQFTAPFSLSAAYQAGNYPTIGAEDATKVRHTLQLLLRWTILARTARVAPFLETGGNVSFGYTQIEGVGDEESKVGYGPLFGVGLDIAVSDRASVVIEAISNLTFPDDAMDGFEEEDNGFASFDLLNYLGLGLKYNFRSALTPVNILALDCPTELEAGESGSFSSTINQDATQPVELRWEFGDNTIGTGTVTSHTFAQAGTYTVSVTASNRGSSDVESCTVTVVPPPVPAEVLSLNANPMTFEVCEPVTVNFSANVRGDQPVTYEWDFGDGSTGTGPNPSHTYTQEGSYTVVLSVTNEAGTDTETMVIRADPCTSICRDITELNSVYFGRNSSTLTPEGREALRENAELLNACEDLCVRIEGFAAPGERNPQQLSLDRARAVEQYYLTSGIAGDRLNPIGMGRVAGMTSKKEGTSQFQRVDSIPTPCGQLGN